MARDRARALAERHRTVAFRIIRPQPRGGLRQANKANGAVTPA